MTVLSPVRALFVGIFDTLGTLVDVEFRLGLENEFFREELLFFEDMVVLLMLASETLCLIILLDLGELSGTSLQLLCL